MTQPISRLRAALAVLACLLLMAPAAQAQLLPPGLTLPGSGNSSSEGGEAAGQPDNRVSDVRALIRILEDENARSRLIDELEAIDSAGADGSPSGAASEEVTPSLGERITATVPALARDFIRDVGDIWRELRATVQRLSGFSRTDTDELERLLLGIAPVAAVAIFIYLIARRLLLPTFRRLGAAADHSRIVHTATLGLAVVLLDFGAVLAGAGAGAATLVLAGTEDETLTAFRMVFLMAFLGAGGLLVALRAVFRPSTPHLRPLPVDDAGARYWCNRLGVVAIVLAFGEIFLRGIISETASPLTARATLVPIYIVIGLYLTGLILLNRHAPSAYFDRRAAENDEDLTFSVLAGVLRYWHWVSIGFLLALMHQVVTSGGGALPLAFKATEIVAAFAVGAFVITLITQLGSRGVRLPDRLNRAMPAMERRVGAFVPAFLKLFRLVVLVLWLAFTLQVLGLLDFRAWLERRVGVDVLAAGASVLLIVLLAFLGWLALSSWIDYRLTPRRGQMPTSRETTLLSLLRNAATVVIVLIGLMFALSELGISIAPLIASAGVLGLAIGFGAQKMVEDIIGGVFIQFENAANVGDVVSAGGTTGVVEALTIRSVGLRDLHGVYHVIPFSAVSTVSNFTRGFGYHVADIGIAYRENIDEAKAEILAAYDTLKADPELGHKLLGDLEWFGVEALGDSAVTLRARLKTWPGEQWTLGRAFNEQIKKRFDAADIQIPFPHLTLWFGEEKDGTAPPAHLAIDRHRMSAAAARAAAPPPAAPARDTRIRPGSPTDAEQEGGDWEGGDR